MHNGSLVDILFIYNGHLTLALVWPRWQEKNPSHYAHGNGHGHVRVNARLRLRHIKRAIQDSGLEYPRWLGRSLVTQVGPWGACWWRSDPIQHSKVGQDDRGQHGHGRILINDAAKQQDPTSCVRFFFLRPVIDRAPQPSKRKFHTGSGILLFRSVVD